MQASPTCERYVRTYVTVPVRNKVSKATAVAWAKWRVGHPNWKPNPAVHRPRYKMSRKEQLEKVAFACEVPTELKLVDVMFTPADLNPPSPYITAPDTDNPVTPVAPPLETADATIPGDLPPVTDTRTPPYANIDFPPSGAPYFPPVFGAFPPPPSTTQASSPPPEGGSTTVGILPPGAAVPEPSSYLLVATGAGFLLLLVWPGLSDRRELARATSRRRCASRL